MKIGKKVVRVQDVCAERDFDSVFYIQDLYTENVYEREDGEKEPLIALIPMFRNPDGEYVMGHWDERFYVTLTRLMSDFVAMDSKIYSLIKDTKDINKTLYDEKINPKIGLFTTWIDKIQNEADKEDICALYSGPTNPNSGANPNILEEPQQMD